MVRACFKNEWRWNPNEGTEYETNRKMPKTQAKIRMGTAGYERCHTEGGTGH